MAQNNKANKNKQTKQQGGKKDFSSPKLGEVLTYEKRITPLSTTACSQNELFYDGQILHLVNTQEKASQQKKKQQSTEQKSSGVCKWVLGSLVLIALIAGVLIYDTNVNGKGLFERSATGKVLNNAGLLPYVEKVWYTSMGAAARCYKWAELYVPPYAKPAGKLVSDLFKLACNAACNIYGVLSEFVASKLPVAANFLEQYVPGLPKKIGDTFFVVKNICEDVFGKTVSFFKTQVFIGRFSPENLNKVLNQTQTAALEYYIHFHKKVDTYSKLK